MTASINLAGKRFGKLVAVEKIYDDASKCFKWLCKCDCGGESRSKTGWLTSGKSKSCGCVRKETVSKLSFNDLTGNRFGRLVVVSFIGVNKFSKRTWKCVCDCGAITEVISSHLKNGTTKSCGCLSVEKNIDRSTKHGLCKLTHKERCDIDEVYASSSRIRTLVANCFGNKTFSKKKRTEEILGCSLDEFKRHIEKQFVSGMNWKNRRLWHIDHIVPISTAVTVEDVEKLNHHTNMRPMWAKDNLKKHAKSQYLI